MTETMSPFWLGPSNRVKTPNGVLLIGYCVGGKIVCSQVHGRLDLEHVTEMLAISQASLERFREISIFAEFRGLTGYESAGRRTLTAWADEAGSGLKSLHVLSSNRIVNMGISVASMMVKPLVAHQSLPDFLETLSKMGGEHREMS